MKARFFHDMVDKNFFLGVEIDDDDDDPWTAVFCHVAVSLNDDLFKELVDYF